MFESQRCCVIACFLAASCNGKSVAPAGHELQSAVAPSASAAPAAASAEPAIAELPGEPSAPSRPPFLTPYPPGKWRLEPELRRVVVWGSHILIRHAGSRPEVPFSLTYWSSVPESVTRSRDEALALAREIAIAARESPREFEALARRHSEDLPTREDGGFLGGFSAAELSSWPQVLDAFAAIGVGAVSDVVETRYGFHILRRAEKPPERQLEGAHIVIGHQRAKWLEVLGHRDVPTRTREQALALATEIYERAKLDPTQFGELAERYSEHRDHVVGGDFGRWSTWEMNTFPGRMRRLLQLAVGEIAPPVETHVGFEIVRRTQPRARGQYRARSISLRFEPEAATAEENSRDTVLANAVALAKELAQDPSKFDALSADSLVDDQWEEGRGVPQLTLQVEKLEPGAIASEPVQAEFRFLIARREAPQPRAPLGYRAELPAPAQPNLEAYFAEEPLEILEATLQAAVERLGQKLSSTQRARLAELHKLQGRVSPDRTVEEQLAMFRALRDDVKALLGPALYSNYLASLRTLVASTLLSDAYRGLPKGGI
jgi:parvulin-like peptidyl-prolyl isomerase